MKAKTVLFERLKKKYFILKKILNTKETVENINQTLSEKKNIFKELKCLKKEIDLNEKKKC